MTIGHLPDAISAALPLVYAADGAADRDSHRILAPSVLQR